MIFNEDINLPAFDWIGSITGGFDIWLVNYIGDNFSDMYQTDLGVQFGSGVYPGDSVCRSTQNQSIFHEMHAIGLLELVMVADQFNNIIKKNLTR